MAGRLLTISGLLLAAQAATAFSLYPTVNADKLASAFGVSIDCLTALNETVACDQNLFEMASAVDDYHWEQDNVTSLCTADCLSSASTWWQGVVDKCSNDTITSYGRVYPAETVSGRYIDGLNIACLQPNTDLSRDPGLNATDITTFSGNSSDSSASKKRDDSWCLIESQSWVGSDIIRPDCPDTDVTVNGTDQCSDPTNVPPENERIANLYPDSMLCSDCFVKMFYLRVASPYLPDTDHSDYLVQQYQDIISVCQKEMPELIVRDLPDYGYSDGVYNGVPLAVSNSTPNDTAPCAARLISASDLPSNLSNATDCDALVHAYNVSTGAAWRSTGSPSCQIHTTPAICLPQACTLVKVPTNSTCDSMVNLISSDTMNVTATQFALWNPNLMGFCGDLAEGQYVCASPPGGAFVLPPALNGTADASSQARGGGGGGGGGSADLGNSTSSTTPASATTPTSVSGASDTPTATQSGIPTDCSKFVQAKDGDTCSSLIQSNNLSADDFYKMNPVLGQGGSACGTQIWPNYYYCVAEASVQTPAPAPAPVPAASTPSPVQSGFPSDCTKYIQAKAGDSCSSLAQENNLSADDFYKMNPVLGQGGSACATQIWPDYYYCVAEARAAASSPAATSGNDSPSPSPTQSGITSNCNKYAESQNDDNCSSFAKANGISTDDLYTWNTVLGNGGSACDSQFWLNYYYCTGVSS